MRKQRLPMQGLSYEPYTVLSAVHYWIYDVDIARYIFTMSRRLLGHHTFKGRGAASNPGGRFDGLTTDEAHSNWYEEEAPTHIEETVIPDAARTLICTNQSPDVGFEASINPYRGCAHGCIYCFARPTHSYVGLSPGLDFETKLFYKADAVALLEAELSKPRYECKPIALGINTDGYQPLEKRLGVTRSILEVLARCRHPVIIVTKSALILRDANLLAGMAKDRLVSVSLSITSLDPELKRVLEPRTASPQARLRVIEELSRVNVPVGVLVAPVIPAVTDHELESILIAAHRAGATSASYVMLRLPHELKQLFREWLHDHYPDRAKHVMSLLNQTFGGRDYDSTFGVRMRGTGAYADLLRARFELIRRKLGFADAHRRPALDTSLFRPPSRGGQMSMDF